MITTDLLTTFFEIAKRRSLTFAARALMLTQPALSQRIKQLESQVGTSLFYRKRSGMVLNKAGQELLEQCAGLQREMKKISDWMTAKRGMIEGRVAIACPSSFMTYIFPDFLQAFLKEYPKVTVNILATVSEETEEKVIRGEADVGILIGKSKKHSLKIQRLCDSDLLMVCSPDHPLAKKKTILKEDIVRARVIWHSDQRSRTVHAILKKLNLNYHETEGIRVSDLEASKVYAMKGLGIAFISKWHITDELKQGKLTILPGFAENRPFYLITRNEKHDSPTVGIFKTRLVEFCVNLKP